MDLCVISIQLTAYIPFNFSVQFYLYKVKSQQPSPQDALYCKDVRKKYKEKPTIKWPGTSQLWEGGKIPFNRKFDHNQ